MALAVRKSIERLAVHPRREAYLTSVPWGLVPRSDEQVEYPPTVGGVS